MDDKVELLLNGQQYKKLQEVCYGNLLEKYNLSIADIKVLLFFYEHEGFDTAKDIVKVHYLTKSYVSKSVDKLLAKGLLAKKDLRDDRRYIHLLIKDEALPLITAVEERRERMMQELFRGITEEQKETLKQVALKMSENIAGMLSG